MRDSPSGNPEIQRDIHTSKGVVFNGHILVFPEDQNREEYR